MSAYATPKTMPQMAPEKQTRDFQPFLRRARYIDKLVVRLQEARAEREEATAALLDHLGLQVVHPLEHGFQALDLLSIIQPEGEHWIWTGPRNGHGSPVIYPHVNKNRSYFGASKLVHQAVIGCQHQGAYFPRCGRQDCVLPSHRCKTCAGEGLS